MHKYALKIAYDGTGYGGWQIQQNAPSIQGVIEEHLSTILQQKVSVVGSGRTDAGVHALGQVAHFTSLQTLDLHRILYSLNQLLPKEIQALEIRSVPIEFHARYSAKTKIYCYHLHLHPIRNPFTHLFSYHPLHRVNLQAIQDSLPYFIGTHDFTSFAHEAHAGASAKDPIRTIHRLEMLEEKEGIALLFEGDGFLYKMVRNITGTLLDISCNKISKEKIPSIFAAKDRKSAGKTAPAHGLFLVDVKYGEKLF